MKGYNVFRDSIPEELKEKYAEEYAQTSAVLDAADLISEAMEAQGLNQKELAAKLGVSKGYVSRLLSGNENMTVKSVARVLHVLGTSYVQSTEPRHANKTTATVLHFVDYQKQPSMNNSEVHVSNDQHNSPWLSMVQ